MANHATENRMTDETSPAPAEITAPEPSPSPEPAPVATPHGILADIHLLLARVEGLEHEIKAELVADLRAVAAKLKALL
jgi:hypothetical protein